MNNGADVKLLIVLCSLFIAHSSMRHLFLSLIAVMGIALSACAGSKAITFIAPGGDKVPLLVEVADTPTERSKGLMERASLEPGAGMLFAFKEPQMLQFWMKDTKIPLEILFFDAQGNFVNASTMQPCTADPCPTYSSAALAKYAVEVNPGFREQSGVGVGWTIDVEKVKNLSKPE